MAFLFRVFVQRSDTVNQNTLADLCSIVVSANYYIIIAKVQTHSQKEVRPH